MAGTYARHARIRGWHRGATAVALATTAILVAAGCGSHASSSGGASKARSGGTLTFALDEGLSGLNSLENGDVLDVLTEVMDQTLPRVFVTQPDLQEALNTEVVTSATVVKTDPQTIVYQINPKAVWSDGVPINAADFIYNWQVQSGNPAFKDVGGKPFQPAATTGYNQIASVTGSHNGKTVTVIMSKPFGDWKWLFSQSSPLIPAHIAKKVGFDNGFQKFGPAVRVSGGPYELQSYAPGKELVEVRNPHYWGPAGKLNRIVYRFITDDSQQPAAVRSGEVNMVNPVLASIPYLHSLKSIPGFTVSVQPSLEFQHIDFNEADPYLALAGVRHAIAYGTNRPQMISKIVTPISGGIGPLNSHVFMPTQAGYADESSGYGDFDPARAERLLRQAGMTMGSDGYFHPGFGPEKGQDFTLAISTTSGEQVRSEIEQLFQANMKAIGVKITIRNYSADTLFGTIAPEGKFQIVEFAWVDVPFPSENEAPYCSYTGANCAINWDHYSDPKVDALFNRAAVIVNPAQAAVLYNQADRLLWSDMVTLPLFQDPELFGWSSKYTGVIPNTSNLGIPWDANDWAMK